MFDQGYFAYRDDPISLFFNRVINGMLRSQILTWGLMAVFSFLASVALWNTVVDVYVRTYGLPHRAPVIAESWDPDTNQTVTFRYDGAGMPDSWRLIEPAWNGRNQAGEASVMMLSSPRKSCREAASVVLHYLPDHPGIFVVEGDVFAAVYRPFIGLLSLLIAGACAWNFSRIASGKPAITLPTWSQWNGT